MTTVTLMAKIRAKAGLEAEATAWLATLLPPTREEPGCLTYTLLAEAEDPAAMTFYEVWADKAALDVHLAGENFAAFIAGKEKYLEEAVTLTFYTMI